MSGVGASDPLSDFYLAMLDRDTVLTRAAADEIRRLRAELASVDLALKPLDRQPPLTRAEVIQAVVLDGRRAENGRRTRARWDSYRAARGQTK